MPSVRSPQVCLTPALTALNSPGGGLACPELLKPQQVSVLSVCSPQLWYPPALMAVNGPAGGVACP